jgi:predicted RNA-binding Zn-ribbon protein involved in translation (DUF1610 family)
LYPLRASEGESVSKFICKSCGWEITNAKWWWIAKDYEGNYLCDDCATDEDIKQLQEREGAR